MDSVVISRLQFAATTVYHFFFVPLTLGLVWIVAIMETIYVRTGEEKYKRMTKFWGKLFLINFAMGVVTGIVQEFQFGMNWSEYSRFVGDIFGAPLAIEALTAFFLESTFLGVWIFGWDRISKGMHAGVIWLVAIGSNLSALWILIANAFMQHPVGYVINPQTGRAELNDFFALVLNPKAQVMFPHTIASGLVTAAFFVLGISVYHLVRKNEVEIFKRSFQIAAVLAMFSSVAVILTGHEQGIEMLQSQPMKMASVEALWETENPASFSLLTIGDLSLKREIWSIRVPRLLSFISYNQLEGEVRGINDLQAEYEATYGPGDYVPLVAITYWTFRFMVGTGFLMLALAGYALFQVMTEGIEKMRWAKVFLYAIALPYIATTSGWILTEVGRQPWIVYGLLRTDQGVSPNVSGGMVLFSLIGFVIIYAALMAADIYLLTRFAKEGPTATDRGFIGVEPALAGSQD